MYNKNPFFLLPTELDAIKIHAERPVFGNAIVDKIASSKGRTGATGMTKNMMSNNLSGGMTN